MRRFSTSGPQGKVIGLDPNPDMLSVARRKSDMIEWRDGKAEALPFADASFDAVVSQFGFMFFEDRAAALREMMRVLHPGGRLAVAVCDAVEHSPGYAAFADLLQRLFGKTSPMLSARHSPSATPSDCSAICDEAGIADAKIAQRNGAVRFSSIKALVSTERACVWTLGGVLDESQFALLLKEAEEALKPFVDASGGDHVRHAGADHHGYKAVVGT